MRESKSWIGKEATGPVPVELIANLEDQLGQEEENWNYESSDEDYSYDENSDGEIVKRKSKYPIISMQEKIRKKVFVRIQEQRAKGEKMVGKICPGIFKKLKKSIARTQWLEVLWNGEHGFEVKKINGRGRQYTVNLENKTCSCGYF
jgi:hypothetical protein